MGQQVATNSAGAPQQSSMQTPIQRLTGYGHLSGLSPSERTNVLEIAGSGVKGVTGLIPIVGPTYQAAADIKNGDYESAGLNASAAVLGPIPRALPGIVKMVASGKDWLDTSGSLVGIGNRK